MPVASEHVTHIFRVHVHDVPVIVPGHDDVPSHVTSSPTSARMLATAVPPLHVFLNFAAIVLQSSNVRPKPAAQGRSASRHSTALRSMLRLFCVGLKMSVVRCAGGWWAG